MLTILVLFVLCVFGRLFVCERNEKKYDCIIYYFIIVQ